MVNLLNRLSGNSDSLHANWCTTLCRFESVSYLMSLYFSGLITIPIFIQYLLNSWVTQEWYQVLGSLTLSVMQ